MIIPLCFPPVEIRKTLLNKNKNKNENGQYSKLLTNILFILDQTKLLMAGIVVNRAFTVLHGGSLAITLTDPLS